MFKLSFILHDHGWAAVSISDGDATVQVDASFLSDALGDLARAARGTLRGLTETSFALQQEPGEHRVVVGREGDRVRVRVARSSKNFAQCDSHEVIMSADCSLREFANECINCLRRVLDEHGEDGYHKKWKNHEFPLQQYRDLLELRHELR